MLFVVEGTVLVSLDLESAAPEPVWAAQISKGFWVPTYLNHRFKLLSFSAHRQYHSTHYAGAQERTLIQKMNTLSFALSALLGLLIQATFSLGSYLSLAELTRRNPCDGVNAEPILYHSYGEADCPANFHVQPDGTCSGWASETNDCVSFCQQSQ